MAHGHTKLDEADTQPIGAQLWPTFRVLCAVALAGLVLLVLGVALAGGEMRRFFFAYLIGYTFVLGLTVGSVALVILTHLFRAGWVVAVRRVPETFAANFWIVAVLGLPLLPAVFMPTAPLYPWSISQEKAQENLEQAEKFIHDYEAGHLTAADLHKAHEPEPAAGAAEIVYTADAPSAGGHDGAAHDGPRLAEPAEAYEDATAPMAGMAYPEDKAFAREVQKMYYTGLLSYMLDYKVFGGQLDGNGQVPIDDPDGDGVGAGKGFVWYLPGLFTLRMVVYFGLFSLIGWFYWRRSVMQDETKDPELTTRREWWAPPATVTFALITTFMSFDLLMSLDPAWYSTMFGVIFFANSFTAAIAGTILVCMVLQKKGYLKTVNVEHYHDLGKLLFAFVFFWGYVSFSQFMLIWYASLPETTYWFEIHGMTTVKTAPQYGSGWSYISLLILFGHLFVPFAFLLSRHVKRNLTALAGAATWMLLMVYLDFYWYVMPFYESPAVTFGFAEIGAVVMLLAMVLAAFVYRYRQHAPLAHGDPRLHETTALNTSVWAPIHH